MRVFKIKAAHTITIGKSVMTFSNVYSQSSQRARRQGSERIMIITIIIIIAAAPR